MIKRTSETLKRVRNFKYILVLEGIAVGFLSGLISIVFRLTLENADMLLKTAIDFGNDNRWFIPIWFLILILAAILVALLLKWEPFISGSGIPQVEGEMQGHNSQKWWRVLSVKFVGSVLSIGSGLSLGREGPSIQLGAMAGKGLSKILGRVKTEEKIMTTCGASGGLAASFNAPLAGAIFSLEELHKNFSVVVLLSALSSSIAADFLSRNVFGLKPIFNFSEIAMMDLKNYWMVIVLGILLGSIGCLYNFCTEKIQNFYDKIKNRFIKIVIPFIIAGILAFTVPEVLGGGHGLIVSISAGMPFKLLLFLFIFKFAFSIISFGSGAPGGIFLPLLVLGAMSGELFHGVFCMMEVEIPLQNFIVLGMAGMFAGVVRAPVTGIILIIEMTGSFSNLLSLALVSLTAYIVADLLKSKPIYHQLLNRMISKNKIPMKKSGEKVLVESPVYEGAPISGKKVSEIGFPKGCLIISIIRGQDEFVPHGETVIMSGDTVVVLCDENDSVCINGILESLCKSVNVYVVK